MPISGRAQFQPARWIVSTSHLHGRLSIARNTATMRLHSILVSKWIYEFTIQHIWKFCIRHRCADLPAFSKYRQCSIRDMRCMREVRSAITSLRPPNDTLGFHGQNDTGFYWIILFIFMHWHTILYGRSWTSTENWHSFIPLHVNTQYYFHEFSEIWRLHK